MLKSYNLILDKAVVCQLFQSVSETQDDRLLNVINDIDVTLLYHCQFF